MRDISRRQLFAMGAAAAVAPMLPAAAPSPVFMGMDFGVGDATSLFVLQPYQREILPLLQEVYGHLMVGDTVTFADKPGQTFRVTDHG